MRSLANRVAFMVELVTDLVMGSDGLATGQGGGERGDNEIDAETGWHFGFYSRPKDGATGVVLKVGGEGNTALLVAYGDKQYALTLEKGEVGMKNAFGASVLLNKDGAVVATASAGQKVQLNGNDYALPKWNIFSDDLQTALGTINGIALPTATLPQVAAALNTLVGALQAFAAAKATAIDWKSTKATNG